MINPPQVLPEEPTAGNAARWVLWGQKPAMAALPDKAARPVLGGGTRVTRFPTAIASHPFPRAPAKVALPKPIAGAQPESEIGDQGFRARDYQQVIFAACSARRSDLP